MGAAKVFDVRGAVMDCERLLRAMGWHVCGKGDLTTSEIQETVVQCEGDAKAASLILNIRLGRARSERRLRVNEK